MQICLCYFVSASPGVYNMAVTCANFQKSFIALFPHFSILVGVIIIVGQLVVIALALGSPQSLGLFENVAHPGFSNETVVLNTEQRISLGVATFVIIVEAIVFGSIQSYREFRRAVNKASGIRPSQGNVNEQEEADSNVPTLGNPLIQEDSSSFYNSFNQQTPLRQDSYIDLHPSMQKLVRSLVVRYVAEVAFEVVDFLWKWTLALLVIRNNWLSVAIAIVGGIGYHILAVWKGYLSTPMIPIIKPKKTS